MIVPTRRVPRDWSRRSGRAHCSGEQGRIFAGGQSMATPGGAKKLSIAAATSNGRIIAGRWPDPSITTSLLFGISEARFCMAAVVTNASFSPWMRSVGVVISARRATRSASAGGTSPLSRSAASGSARRRKWWPQRRMCSTSGSGVHCSMNHRMRSECVSPGHVDGSRAGESGPASGGRTPAAPFMSSSPSNRVGSRRSPACSACRRRRTSATSILWRHHGGYRFPCGFAGAAADSSRTRGSVKSARALAQWRTLNESRTSTRRPS